ncbi:DUF1266 domain-containing protein [Microbacterium sp. 179-B 1A2 NHS]|uniref:DUF1266 domain-containing protein n=1 Tax=Microbacterium sp. 179-B 1A2 NHS TaxID=3142383 RepID=UPI0039A04A1D
MTESASALQNHPGDVEFPVRMRRKYARLLEARRRADPAEMRRRALPVTLIAAPFGIAAFALSLVWDVTEFGLNLFAFFIGMCLGLLVASIILAVVDAGAPARAQRQYLARAGLTALTPHQQQILALDAASDFAARGWNSSLAFTPTFAELPQDVRATHRDGEEGRPWFALPMSSLRQLRAALDDQFKIVSRSDAEMMVADTLTLGPNSARFAQVAQSDSAEHMMSRIAALTGLPVFDIHDLARAGDTEPARLLLAADIERAVGGIRYAYVAGYLTADETWALLEPIAAKAFETYRGWDEYWRDVVIATAFRTDSLEAVQSQRDALGELRRSDWPAASVPWPAR